MITKPQETSSQDSPPSDPPQPAKSRNARAQARHRAKRKAYIEQLEETVTRLQAALSNHEQQSTAGNPASVPRLRELEQENFRLRREIELLKTQLALSSPVDDRPSSSAFNFSSDDILDDPRGSKRRRTSEVDSMDSNLFLPPIPPSSTSSYSLQSLPMLSPTTSIGTSNPLSATTAYSSVGQLYGYGQYPGHGGTASSTQAPFPTPAAARPASVRPHDPAVYLPPFRDPGTAAMYTAQSSRATDFPSFELGYPRRTS